MNTPDNSQFDVIHELVAAYVRERCEGISGSWYGLRNVSRRIFLIRSDIDMKLWDADIKQTYYAREKLRSGLHVNAVQPNDIGGYIVSQRSHGIRVNNRKSYVALYPIFVTSLAAFAVSTSVGRVVLAGAFAIVAAAIGILVLMDRFRMLEHESLMKEVTLVLRHEMQRIRHQALLASKIQGKKSQKAIARKEAVQRRLSSSLLD